MKNDSIFTAGARNHLRLLLRFTRPLAALLERQFRAVLRQRPYDGPQIRALLAIAPAAASRLCTLDQSDEQVQYNGRRLARLNLPISEVCEVLGEFVELLETALGDSFAPPRDLLQ